MVDDQGAIVAGRANPAVIELRLQRQQLARLLVALRVPLAEDEDGGRTQYRGLRGMYAIDGGAS
jgi:hypothetical protein